MPPALGKSWERARILIRQKFTRATWPQWPANCARNVQAGVKGLERAREMVTCLPGLLLPGEEGTPSKTKPSRLPTAAPDVDQLAAHSRNCEPTQAQ